MSLMMLLGFCAAVLASPNPYHHPLHHHPLITGDEISTGPAFYPPYKMPENRGLDVVGDTMTVGTTWYEYQHNGTISRMIELSSDGYAQMVWMKAADPGSITRHIFYNTVDPTGTVGWPETGIVVDNAVRGGYATMALDPSGIALVSYHMDDQQGVTVTGVSNDLFLHSGSFLNWNPEQQTDEWIWPHLGVDRQNGVHILSTAFADNVVRYCHGVFDPNSFSITYPSWPGNWTYVDSSQTIGPDVGTSDVSDRVCCAWTHPRGLDYGTPLNQENNDISYALTTAGQPFDFTNPINLTNFIPPDSTLLPDTLMADMDTLRAYCDVNAFFDMDDYLHIAFTTQGYYELEGTATYGPSLVWHWSEQYPEYYTLIANGWIEGVDPGGWQLNAQRPSMGQDPSTGYLYCTYHVFDQDPGRLSHMNYPSGEVYVSVSTNGGLDWSVGTNITNTLTPANADSGQSLSEIFPSMAKVVNGYCHIFYMFDHEAGSYIQGEGLPTISEAKYHRVPVGAISTTPLLPNNIPFHVGTPPGVQPGETGSQSVKVFQLKQNYPNPFNPTTTISFSLDRACEVTLNVYNLRGEVVAEVASGAYGIGQHTVTFDGSNLASGVYLYRLKAENRSLENKMLLLK